MKSFRKLLMAAATSMAAALSSHAAVEISQFQFTAGSLASDDGEPVTSTSSITFGSGIDGTIENAKADASNDRLEINCIATTPAGPTGQNLAAQLGFAITNNQYSSFTVTIPATHVVDLTQLTFTYSTFDAFRFGMGVLTDKTGFALGDQLLGRYVNLGNNTFNDVIDLSGIAALQGLTNTTVEFRFYTGDNSTSAAREHRFDDIVLSGVVEVAGDDPYLEWAGEGVLFGDDANGDGVSNGLAFLLGATGPNASALDKLPTVTESAGALTLGFSMLNDQERGDATLSLEYGSDLVGWTTVTVPDTEGQSSVGDVTFNVTTGAPLNTVTATIASDAANGTGKLFARCKATEN